MGGDRMSTLSAFRRNHLPSSDFALAGRRYPIEDQAHARDALARSSGKPEHGRVVAAVKRRYPEIEVESG